MPKMSVVLGCRRAKAQPLWEEEDGPPRHAALGERSWLAVCRAKPTGAFSPWTHWPMATANPPSDRVFLILALTILYHQTSYPITQTSCPEPRTPL